MNASAAIMDSTLGLGKGRGSARLGNRAGAINDVLFGTGLRRSRRCLSVQAGQMPHKHPGKGVSPRAPRARHGRLTDPPASTNVPRLIRHCVDLAWRLRDLATNRHE